MDSNDKDNEFMRRSFERFADRQRNHAAFAEKLGELVQNVIAAGMSEDLLREVLDQGIERGRYLRDKHQTGGEIVDIQR
jgi:hypothetical protein